jgi:hypothetical protein
MKARLAAGAAVLLFVAVLSIGTATGKDPEASPTKSPTATPTKSPTPVPSPSPSPDPVCDVFVPAPSGFNDTASIEQAEAQTPDGGTLCFPESASYISEQTWAIVERIDLTVLGNGSTLRATSLVGDSEPDDPKCCVRRHVDITLSDDVSISDLNVLGANETCTYDHVFEFEHGFHIAGSQGIVLDHVGVAHVGGDFVSLTEFKSPTLRRDATDILVTDPTFDCNGRQGFSSSGGVRRFASVGGTIDRVARSLVDIEQIRDDQTTEDFSVTYATVGFVRNVACCGGGQGTVRGVKFSHNTLDRMWLKVGSPNEVADWFDVEMVGNVAQVFPTRSTPWGFVGVLGVTLRDNVQPIPPESQPPKVPITIYAVSLTDTCDVFASGNTVENADAFWPPPGPPGPEGCPWIDGGGNST